MTTWYVDTSAALKLLVEERESAALVAAVEPGEIALAGTWLVETELRRAAGRIPALTQSMVTDLLDEFDLYEMPASLYREAGLLPGDSLRSLDALHLAAAVRIGVDGVCTYDLRMQESAERLGLPVHMPGRSS
ncbi:type II toxin-antitoxin system VapC family toxin [Nocardioides sp. Root151]|uniref:type II toxin-antitoxin system VapC family toxin n=1 Tax=Nocardioides sp. Root151 TaxID=1736475 RepID=UPI000702E159|nr:type II toxin-antitoxin system VapC family toxin [Nocardioides sp. Root151]KQZ67115.1 hypothetical protein ASD66_19175 [Nocardioides sp. Root151]